MLTIDKLTKTYPTRGRGLRRVRHTAVREASLTVSAGEAVGLIGETGSGKSTIARCVLRLVTPDHGRILFDERNISDLRRKELRRYRRNVQAVFQNPAASLDPRQSVFSSVAEPARFHLDLDRAALSQRVMDVLAEVGLDSGLAARRPHELSGGQQQRVSIARALVCRPRLLVLDEPTSALDASIRGQVLNLLARLRRELELSYLYISHDIQSVVALCDRAYVLYRGDMVESGDVDTLLSAPKHGYTQALIAASNIANVATTPRHSLGDSE